MLPHARHIGWWGRGGVTAMSGWREIGTRFKWLMEANPDPNPTARAVRRGELQHPGERGPGLGDF